MTQLLRSHGRCSCGGPLYKDRTKCLDCLVEHSELMRKFRMRHKLQRGQNNGNARLTWRNINWIVEQRVQGRTQQSIANDLGVSRSTIGAILAGQNWRS